MRKQFGAKPTKADIQQYEQSPQWDGEKFVNSEPTSMAISIRTLPKLLYKQFCEKKDREPSQPLPIQPFDKEAFVTNDNEVRYIWYGHSVVLLRIKGKNILIDPMLGSNAAPIAPFPIKRFSENTLAIIDQLPEIDLVLLSHDHYDHLDYDSIQKLHSKAKQFYVALGVKRHLVKWNINPEIITEFDWWQEVSFQDIKITFTPTRHFSGRGLTDRAKSLWGGWVLKTATENIWFSGDSGYGPHFEAIGKRLGPFDFAFMECGQYNENWSQIHMFPEETVQAAIDAKVHNMMPVHWAGFALAQHTWTDPVERFITATIKEECNYNLPKLGTIQTITNQNHTPWWK
ncbi:MBL fold metallo-hydrolase [Flavobacterium sp. J27]|uniref:MBL fold metallo-hydrolase n=1 Tax=Flavobacterium sp. J27 TaxID=2060419 RepID=UPI00103086F7|nr:MBL fold metallo-hydrolase [Flavobacterium sp. J27]